MSTANPEPCSEWNLMLQGFVDGELDAAHSLQIEQHIAVCPHCAEQLKGLQALKQRIGQRGVHWRMPDYVRAQVLEAISREAAIEMQGSASGREKVAGLNFLGFVRRWIFGPVLAALAVSLFLVIVPLSDRSSIGDEVIASHIRSLLVDHLTDVATSDQHTVKPWFNGKIDFAPPVVDLVREGFSLDGGRVDYVGGRVVAALVYRRQSHVINLFVWPSSGGPTASVRTAASRDGYNIQNWSAGGLMFWAVSDVSADDLERFRHAFYGRTGK